MTVEELIERLKGFSPQAQVLIPGYETGWDAILELQQDVMRRFTNPESWDGEYDRSHAMAQLLEGDCSWPVASTKSIEIDPVEVSAVLLMGRHGAHR